MYIANVTNAWNEHTVSTSLNMSSRCPFTCKINFIYRPSVQKMKVCSQWMHTRVNITNNIVLVYKMYKVYDQVKTQKTVRLPVTPSAPKLNAC